MIVAKYFQARQLFRPIYQLQQRQGHPIMQINSMLISISEFDNNDISIGMHELGCRLALFCMICNLVLKWDRQPA